MKSDNADNFPQWVIDAIADLPPLVPAGQVAEFFHVTKRTLRRWIRVQRINAIRTSNSGSGRVLIPRHEMARLLFWLST